MCVVPVLRQLHLPLSTPQNYDIERGEKRHLGVKDSEFIAAKILEEIGTWSQEVQVNNLLICVASVLRISMKNVSKQVIEESV